MSTLSLRLPDSLHNQVRQLADKEGTSINLFITLAVAEKIAALRTVDYLAERGKKGDREAFLKILANAPAIEPETSDRFN